MDQRGRKATGRGKPARKQGQRDRSADVGRKAKKKAAPKEKQARKVTAKPRRPTPRGVAYELTRRVHSKGSYLGLLIRNSVAKAGLSSRDRSMVAELSYGVQRFRNRIDYLIALFSSRPVNEIDPELLDLLRLGMYQLSEMGTPAHAAVNETVELAKAYLGKGEGFVNAVLRNAAMGLREVEWPPRSDLPRYLEIVESHPRWLVEYMIDMFGEEEAEALCRADNRIPTITLRVNTARTDAPAMLEKVLSREGTGRLSERFPEALVEVGVPYEALLEWLEQGLCVVQDESSMAVSRVVDPQPGETVVDACAAPGGKSSHLALLGGEDCRVIAVDRNQRRLKAMKKSIDRQGLKNVEMVKGDAARLSGVVGEQADRVLLDAPCSGLGTLRRNPELKWRRFPGDIANLATVQLKLLMGCADVVRPGGVLVYSLCTFTREETVQVVEAFLERRQEYRLEDLSSLLPKTLRDEVAREGYLQLLPHRHDMEGMFIARFRREG